MSIILSPSILSANFCNLEADLKELEKCGINDIHIDVMDGNFVPNITFGPNQIESIRKVTNMNFDVHLMVQEPIRFIDDFANAGADSITVHAEACTHLHRTLEEIKKKNLGAGVALNPSTPIDNIEYILDIADKILVMTVNPGFGGQKFIECMISKIEKASSLINQRKSSAIIQIDGGINKDNILKVVESGAKDIVLGTAVFNNQRIKENLAEIKAQLI